MRPNLAPLSNIRRIGNSELASLLDGAAVVVVGSCVGGTGAGTFIDLSFALARQTPRWLYYADRDWGMIALEAGERSGRRVTLFTVGLLYDRSRAEALLKLRECSSSLGPITSIELGRDLWRRLHGQSNEEVAWSFCTHALGARCDLSEFAESTPNHISFIEVRTSVKAGGPTEAQGKIYDWVDGFAQADTEQQLAATLRKDHPGSVSLYHRKSRAESVPVYKVMTRDVSGCDYGLSIRAGKDSDCVKILDFKQRASLSWKGSALIDFGVVLYQEICRAVRDARPILGHPEADRLFKTRVLAEGCIQRGLQKTFAAWNEDDAIRAWRADSPCDLPSFVLRPEFNNPVQVCVFDAGRQLDRVEN
jgi:hypothetical protein